MQQGGTYEKLMVDIAAALRPKVQPAKESVSQDFSAGKVSKLKGISQIEADKKDSNDHSAMDTHRSVAQNQDFVPVSEGQQPDMDLLQASQLAAQVESFLLAKRAAIKERASVLKRSGENKKLSALREAYTVACNAAFDLGEACEDLEQFLK